MPISVSAWVRDTHTYVGVFRGFVLVATCVSCVYVGVFRGLFWWLLRGVHALYAMHSHLFTCIDICVCVFICMYTQKNVLTCEMY